MNNFVIHDFDYVAPELPATARLSLFEKLEADGSYIARQTGIGTVWIEDNPDELIEVHVAAKRRYGTLDTVADDQPFRLNVPVFAS